MHLCNSKVRDVHNKPNRNYKTLILVDFDWILNGLKIQGDLMKTIVLKMTEIAEKEVIQEKGVGENNKKYSEDLHHMKKEVLLAIYRMRIWYKISNLNIQEILSNKWLI